MKIFIFHTFTHLHRKKIVSITFFLLMRIYKFFTYIIVYNILDKYSFMAAYIIKIGKPCNMHL